MDRPKDTFIELPYTSIDTVAKYAQRDKLARKGVRIYKDTPSTIALQVWGLRANTPSYGIAHMDRAALTELRDAATALLKYLP